MLLETSPFAWIRYDKSGRIVDPQDVAALRAAIGQPGVTDLVILSHGWNNDVADAQALYGTLWHNAAAALRAAGRDPACIAVAGVLWPAKAYDARTDGAETFAGGTIAEGGVKSFGDASVGEQDVPPERLEEVLRQTADFIDDPAFADVAGAARRAAGPYQDGAALEFFRTSMAALDYDPAEPDIELRQDARLFARAASRDGADQLLDAFAQPRTIDIAPGVGRAQGLGDVVQDVFSGARNGVVWALNKLTYYTMKKRAGIVGEAVANTVKALAPARDIRLHLVGHSFGGRLVTAAAAALEPVSHVEFRSLTLLQAAYSHNGMTEGQGPFAGVIGKPTGPICFTHTHNDKACTVAYPIASRLNGDTAKGLGDKDDIYGAMGANGPQLAGDMLAPDVAGTDFAPMPGRINRFLADGYVVKTATSDAHNNVTNATCGRLVAATIMA